jgi:hypothetical protein
MAALSASICCSTSFWFVSACATVTGLGRIADVELGGLGGELGIEHARDVDHLLQPPHQLPDVRALDVDRNIVPR